jgi:hypothetical protein
VTELPEGREVEFVAWDTNRVPAYLPDVESVTRWAQAQGVDRCVAWRLLHDQGRVELRHFVRVGDAWEVTAPDGIVITTVAADPSDDPRTLAVVNYVAAHMAAIPVEPIRVASPWATESASRWAGAGFDPPLRTPLDEYVWRYCPDLIAERCRDLNDVDFDIVLSTIDTFLSLHVANAHLPLVEREQVLDEQLAVVPTIAKVLRRFAGELANES